MYILFAGTIRSYFGNTIDTLNLTLINDLALTGLAISHWSKLLKSDRSDFNSLILYETLYFE